MRIVLGCDGVLLVFSLGKVKENGILRNNQQISILTHPILYKLMLTLLFTDALCPKQVAYQMMWQREPADVPHQHLSEVKLKSHRSSLTLHMFFFEC